MSEIKALEDWVLALTAALQEHGLAVVAKEESARLTHLTARLPNQSYTYRIALHLENHQVSGKSVPRVVVKMIHPQTEKTIRITNFSEQMVLRLAHYALTALDNYQALDKKLKEQRARRIKSHVLAKNEEISPDHVPAWMTVQPNCESDADADTFHVSFSPEIIGYPLRRLTPAQVKRVLHFLKFIDKDPLPSCSCNCLPCQSCDHR